MRMFNNSVLILSAVSLWELIKVVSGFTAPTSTFRLRIRPPQSQRRGGLFDAVPSNSNSNQHIRILSRSERGTKKSFDIQTAVTKFERIDENGDKQTIELHAQLHYGSREYFDYYNSDAFNSRYDRVLYELLVDESLMKSELGVRVLRPRWDDSPVLMASPADQSTARQYGLSCQVDVMDYTQPGWLHADYTRQEFLELQQLKENGQPLWALASTTIPGAEAISALFRPSTPSTSLQTPVSRRLFSNLFLPGNNFAAVLRALLWLSLPSPELSVMVLDWSSILPRPTGGVSAVALPVLESLLSGHIVEARQLVFGQMVVNSERAGGNDALLVKRRNENAVDVVERALGNGNKKMALLYGGMHCADLSRRLRSLGFVAQTTPQWRTAWTVPIPNFGSGTKTGETFAATVAPEAIAVGIVVLPVYLAIGGVDWIATLQDTAKCMEQGAYVESVLEIVLYLARHVLLYVGLAKFVVDWDGGIGLFR